MRHETRHTHTSHASLLVFHHALRLSNSQSITMNIIIVGAGIAGLSTAIALRRAGHTVQVYTILYPPGLLALLTD